jgi:hypothetical protein
VKAYSYLQLSNPKKRKPVAVSRQIERTQEYCDRIGLALEEFELLEVSAFSASRKDRSVLSGFRKALESGFLFTPCALIVEDMKWITDQDCRWICQEFVDLIELGVEVHTPRNGMVYRPKELDVFSLLLNIGRELAKNEISEVMSLRRRKTPQGDA